MPRRDSETGRRCAICGSAAHTGPDAPAPIWTRRDMLAGSSFPKLFERPRTQFAIMRGVFDIDVTQPELQSPRIMARIREQMPARMSKHVRMRIR